MGEPQRQDPDDRPDPKSPHPSKADWVVGAEEGLSAAPGADTPARPTEAPRLIRPQDPDAGKAREPGRFGASGLFRRPVPAAPVPEAAPSPAMPSWERGASSVPRMRTVEGDVEKAKPTPPPPPFGQPTYAQPSFAPGREFPMDDAEERARVAATVAQQQREEAEIAARPHQVVTPQEFDIPATSPPWWSVMVSQLRDDRRVQLGLGLALLTALVFTFWPRGERTTSIAHLKEHPERYADVPVKVGGKVDEVFSVGGSWAYTVVQGRDTIVVFSRVREPKARERIVVVGTLSRGFLDGQSRVAIFESLQQH